MSGEVRRETRISPLDRMYEFSIQVPLGKVAMSSMETCVLREKEGAGMADTTAQSADRAQSVERKRTMA